MRIISSAESIVGANVRFEHGGKEYIACGSERGQIILQIEKAILEGEDLDKLFCSPNGGTSVDSESEPETTEGEE